MDLINALSEQYHLCLLGHRSMVSWYRRPQAQFQFSLTLTWTWHGSFGRNLTSVSSILNCKSIWTVVRWPLTLCDIAFRIIWNALGNLILCPRGAPPLSYLNDTHSDISSSIPFTRHFTGRSFPNLGWPDSWPVLLFWAGFQRRLFGLDLSVSARVGNRFFAFPLGSW